MLSGRIRLIGNWRGKRLAASLATVLALLAGSGIMATPARASTTQAEHVCEVIGNDKAALGSADGAQAVVCTDLQVIDNGNGTYYSQVRSEGYCQMIESGDIVQCANIWLVNETAYATADPTGTVTEGPADIACGHQYGACPASGNRFYLTGDVAPYISPATCIANTWGVTLAQGDDTEYNLNATVKTSIQLPVSDETFTLSANFATPHISAGNC